MTKNEFISTLEDLLRDRDIEDTADILDEYEQHFAFKLADGFTEEEICARLGTPESIAAQYESSSAGANISERTGVKALKVTGLIFADICVVSFFIILFAWQMVMAAFSASCLAISLCLIGSFDFCTVVPQMPQPVAAVYGITFVTLAILTAAGCLWFGAFILQMIRSYKRFHRNIMTSEAMLPPLPVNPQITPAIKRRLRNITLIVLVIFILAFLAAFVLSIISAGAVEFWHEWGWFGYTGAVS